jgi:hypothetical protein
MHRNVALIILILFSLPIIAARGSEASSFAPRTILPEECRLLVNQKMSLTLDGIIPPRAIVRWGTDRGDILFVLNSSDALFIAPSEPGVVTISASITPTGSEIALPITRQCIVTSLNKAPKGLAQAEELEGFFNHWLAMPNT